MWSGAGHQPRSDESPCQFTFRFFGVLFSLSIHYSCCGRARRAVGTRPMCCTRYWKRLGIPKAVEETGGESGILLRSLNDLSSFQRDRPKSFKIPLVDPRSMCLFRALLSLQFTYIRPKMESKWNRNLA